MGKTTTSTAHDATFAAAKKRKLPPSVYGVSGAISTTAAEPQHAPRPPPAFHPKRRALVRSSSTPPPSKGSLAPSLKAAAFAAAEKEGMGNGAEGSAAAPARPSFYQPGESTKPGGGGNLRLGSALFGLLGGASTTAAAAPSGPVLDDSLLMARLGSLAGARLDLPDAASSPRAAGGAHDDDASSSSSPFNEGYGTRPHLPHDFSLKSSLCFESVRPFDWCRAIQGSIEGNGMLRHLRESTQPVLLAPAQPQEDGEEASTLPQTAEEALETWVAASMYYAQPAEPLAPTMHLPLQMIRKRMNDSFTRDAPPTVSMEEHGSKQQQQNQQGDQALQLFKRLRQWEDAFRHLYTLYRHDPSLSFYLQAPDYTVVWTREEEQEEEKEEKEEGGDDDDTRSTPRLVEPRLKVVISHSKRWLRARLREAAIDFTVPLAPDADARDHEEAAPGAGIVLDTAADPTAPTPAANGGAEEELQELLSSVTGQMAGGMGMVEMQSRRRPKHLKDLPRQRSQLVLRGHVAVQGLFTFLLDLENGLGPSQVADVPRLLADRPFLHGAMQRLQMAFVGKVQRTLLKKKGEEDADEDYYGASLKGPGMETVYQLKVRGPVMPTQLRRLAGVVHYMQRRQRAEEGCREKEKADEEEKDQDWSLVMESLNGTEAFNHGRGKKKLAGGGGKGGGRGGGADVRSLKEVRWSAEKKLFAVITVSS